MQEENKKFKKFDSAFKYEELEETLSGMTAMSGYHITKKNNLDEFNNILNLLPEGYVQKLYDNIESLDFIYSGSTASPYLLTIAAGRNDRFRGSEKFDIDVFNVAPDVGTTASYFRTQWFHFNDEEGKRLSYDINPFVITDELHRKDITYTTFLTASTCYFSMEDYEKERPEFFDIHTNTFKDLH